MKMEPDSGDPRRDRQTFRSAATFAGVVVAVALIVLFAALGWASGCKSDAGHPALDGCTGLQRNLVALGAPAILFLGGAAAFGQTFRVWRARGGWWIWQGAGWFLLALMMVVLTMTAPAALL